MATDPGEVVGAGIGTAIPVNTTLTSVEGEFTYHTYYNELFLLSVFISESLFKEGGTQFIEGEGGARYSDEITCRVEDGDLIIDGLNAEKYSLNDNGELIYTY